jgi:hypothetical protein
MLFSLYIQLKCFIFSDADRDKNRSVQFKMSYIEGQAMKYTVPEEYQAQFNTLIRSVPVELQQDDTFKETVLVYLKMGGISLARRYAETTAKYLNVDVLEIGTGLRFPKVVEAKQEDESDDDDENDDDDDDKNENDNDEDDDEIVEKENLE